MCNTFLYHLMKNMLQIHYIRCRIMNWICCITNHNMNSTNNAHFMTLSFQNMANHMRCSRFTIRTSNANHTHGICWIIKEKWHTCHHSFTSVLYSDNTNITTYLYWFRYKYCYSTSFNSFIYIIMTIYSGTI